MVFALKARFARDIEELDAETGSSRELVEGKYWQCGAERANKPRRQMLKLDNN
jgi:hypothetical protein